MRVESRRLFYLRFTFTRPPGGVKSGDFSAVVTSPKTSERAPQARRRRRGAAPGGASSKEGFSTFGLPLVGRLALASVARPLGRHRAQANLCAAGARVFSASSPSLCVVTDRRRTLNTRTTFRVTALYVMYACVPGRCRSVLARLPREQAGAVNITSGART